MPHDIVLSGILYLLAWTVTYNAAANYFPLNDFIKHHERLSYAAVKPKLYRRSVAEGEQHILQFVAHGRSFKLKLRPDTTTLAPGAQILDGNGKTIDFNRESLSVGELSDEPGSRLHGVLHEDGIFTGKILTKDGIYFVELAKLYFDKPTDFHSVIYKDEHIKYDIKFSEPQVPAVDLNREADEAQSSFKKRIRRAEASSYQHNTCRLSMEADYTFLNMAKETVLAVGEILKHVQALNIVYGVTFNSSQTYAPYSIQFQVGFLQVYDKEQTPRDLQPLNIDVSTFLSRMARKDYSKYCQAVYFTHRDFEGGILGLAWIGHPRGRAGGMCDGRRGSNSYNTAIVTFTLYGRKSPPKVSEITFVHEIGHAFGAEHDENIDAEACAPGGVDGNYIMYGKATSGDREKNSLFSQCSVNQIMANVNAKRERIIDLTAKPRPRLCLESVARMSERKHDLCGNGIVEGDEECDCGPKAFCDVFEPGKCCNWETCRLNTDSGIICSPSQGPCCDKRSCKPVSDKRVCEEKTDCLEAARCPDTNTMLTTKYYKCPEQKAKSNDTPCSGGALLCHNGLCSASICLKHKLKPCECKQRDHECNACCMDGQKCQPAHQITQMARELPYNYSVGTPCANNTGYCDMFQYCQRVDMDGPLLQLFKLYFTSEGIAELTRKYWWAILLGTLGLVGIVVVLVIFGARYTESDNPELKERSPRQSCVCCKRNSSTDDATDSRPAMELREGPRDAIL